MLAWLAAVPKPPPGSKRAARPDDQPRLTRLASMKKDGLVPAMPDNPAPHIVDRLMEIGLFEPGAMSAAPLSWREINEWQAATCVRLAPWEARLIRRLSQDYVAEGRKAESETKPPPCRAETTQREREVAERALRSVLG